MEYTDGMEKIRAYLTEEQIYAYEGLAESMDRLSLNLTDRLNVLREFLEKEGLLDMYTKQLTEEQRKQFLSAAPDPPGMKMRQRKKKKTMKRKRWLKKKLTGRRC